LIKPRNVVFLACGFLAQVASSRSSAGASQRDDHREDEKDEEKLRDGDAATDRQDQEQKYENPDQREPPVFRLPRLA
jgi:hypothetical protein